MTQDVLFNGIGLAGAGIYLVSYFLLQAGFVGGNSKTYAVMNLVAASFVLVSLYTAFNAASAVIQTSWIVISIFGMTRMYLLYRRIEFSDEETRFIADKLPHMQRHLARKVLNHGVWVEAEAGAELTSEGAANQNLTYILEGRADVVLNGAVVATCGAGSFVGEMTLFSNEPATATVRLTSKARYLQLNSRTLRKLCQQESEVAQALEASFSRDMRLKLEASNRSTVVSSGAVPC